MRSQHNFLRAVSAKLQNAGKLPLSGRRTALGFIAIGGISSATAADFYWRGGNGAWTTASNWSTSADGSTTPVAAPSSSATLYFNSTAGANSSQVITGTPSQGHIELIFNSSGSTTLLGNDATTFSLNKGITVNPGAGPVTIGSPTGGWITLSTSQPNTWTNNSANALTIQNSVYGTEGLTLQGSGNTILNGDIVHFNDVPLSKAGTGTVTFNGSNSYQGATHVSGGTLAINGNQQGAIGNVSVSGSGTSLVGTGTVGGHTTLFAGATHSAGTPGGGIGTQTFDKVGSGTTNLTYGSGSIFSWDLDSSLAHTRGIGYDAVNVTGTLGGTDSIFSVDIGNGSFSDTFWESARTWDDIFTNGSGVITNWASIFGGGVRSTSTSGEGAFSLSGNSLVWTPFSPVPEPTGALAGALLAAGMLRRRRDA